MKLAELREEVCRANLELVRARLVTLTWGNVSGIDRAAGVMAIKPSGVPYEGMRPEQMVLVDLEGKVVEGTLRPSTDTPTHLALYRGFGTIGGITHTHSRMATVFAQARCELPCLGTTHADHFHGPVPVTRVLTAREVDEDYEAATGRVILERFAQLDPLALPAVLVAGHAPFAWGSSATHSVENAIALEACAEMALWTRQLQGGWPLLEDYVLEKHHQRKHGARAYYGQTRPAV